MRKAFAYTVIFVLLPPAIYTRLTDSKWRNSMNIPDSYEPIIHFKKDPAILTLAADGSAVETMMYSVSKDRLRLTKVSGLSPCNDQTGLYRIQIRDDKLTIAPIADDCKEAKIDFSNEEDLKRLFNFLQDL